MIVIAVSRTALELCSIQPESVPWAIEDARSLGDGMGWWTAGEPRRRRCQRLTASSDFDFDRRIDRLVTVVDVRRR